MRRNNSYTLTRIADIPYLLPYGQMIADHKPGIRLNDTGIFLWNLLEQERSMDELVQLCASHYEIDTCSETIHSAEYDTFKTDIEEYVSQLCNYGILSNISIDSPSVFAEQFVQIGSLVLKLVGPSPAFASSFEPYYINHSCQADQTIRVFTHPPQIRQNGTVLLHNEELIVMDSIEDNNDSYTLLFPTSKQLIEAHLTKDGTYADFYCLLPFSAELQEELFHAIRLVWLYLAQKNNMMAIHSASILYQDKAWLFSAPSGTGKSTHTNLWNKLFDTPIINGDLNLIAFENGLPVIHGTPWCGTSGISDTETYPLGGIILLKQAKEDCVTELSEDQQQLQVMQRFISPTWSEEMLHHNCKFVSKLAPQILICKLFCTKEDTAAIIMREYIDKRVLD